MGDYKARKYPAEDTIEGDAIFEKVALHVPIDSLGSMEMYVK